MENGLSIPANGFRVKVLVVDDHPNTASMLARALSRLGSRLNVVSATSGKEALEEIEKSPADILITDMVMPGMTGLELIETLSKHPAGGPKVSFLMTAYDMPDLRLASDRLKVKEVLTKPVPPEQICKTISEVMIELELSKSAEAPTLPVESVLKFEKVLLDGLLWDTANHFQAQAKAADQLLVIGKTEPGCGVNGNADHLRKALQEVVEDALLTTPQGGTIMLSMTKDDHSVSIRIIKSGRSDLPSTVLKNIINYLFPSHHQINPIRIKQQEMPPAQASAIIRQHDGEVKFENENGNGASITLSLPLFKEESMQETMERKTYE